MHQDVLEDFLLSLDDLNDRVALALDTLEMPMIRVLPLSAEKIYVRVGPKWHGFSVVLVGLFRALADDCGALVFMDRWSIAIRSSTLR